jgi:aryl-alcohol dehydrogenase-like predicted oxidoreductase
VQSVQIIFNIVRQRPADLFFARAQECGVGILARLPLSSGLLTGKISRASTFATDDHRNFNRAGAAFDKGETFSGLDFDVQLALVEQITPLVPQGMTLAQMALRWILDHPAVTTAIPGGRRPTQIEENARTSDLSPLSPALHAQLDALYQQHAKPRVHHLW